MFVGPRAYVVSELLGRPDRSLLLFSGDPWVAVDPRWLDWRDWPELWVDKVHDYVEF